MKYVSIDIETTGLNPDRNQIIEFAAVIDDLVSPVDKLPKFHLYIMHKDYVVSPYTAILHRRIFEKFENNKLTDYPQESIDANKETFIVQEDLEFYFSNFLFKNGYKVPMQITVAGKNFATFDLLFIKKLNWQKIKFNRRMLDPAILYMDKSDETLPNTEECLKRANINKKVSHAALDDALDVVNLIRNKMQ